MGAGDDGEPEGLAGVLQAFAEHNTGTGFFSNAFFNGCRFTFDSDLAATIAGATVNEDVTTNGLTNARLSFSGNQLSVNVAGLRFAPDLFGRLDLHVEGGPGGGNGGNGAGDGGGPEVIPLPATLPILLSGIALLAGLGSAGRHDVTRKDTRTSLLDS